MTGLEIGLISVAVMVGLILLGLHVAIAIALTSFAVVWIVRDSFSVALKLTSLAATETLNDFLFGVIPLFVVMGLLVSEAGMGRDVYLVAYSVLRRVRGGLGLATVWANAIFAAITGVSTASASVFARVAVPEMLRLGYRKRFAVGVVAGSSVLGMLIPPSVLLILYAVFTEQSVAAMFIAGIVPGLVLSLAYCLLILGMAYFTPRYVLTDAAIARARTDAVPADQSGGELEYLAWPQMIIKIMPITILVVIVLGGIYGGIYTPTEAGAAGAFGALIFSGLRRRLTWTTLWRLFSEAGRIVAAIAFVVIAASMYNRMLGVSGLPTQLGNWLASSKFGVTELLIIYILLILALGAILDSISIMIIVVPLFAGILKPMGVDLVWLGIITVVAVEIGLLTPPFGLSVFVIKSTLQHTDLTIGDIFIGSIPFALTMLVVLILLVIFPVLSTGLVR